MNIPVIGSLFGIPGPLFTQALLNPGGKDLAAEFPSLTIPQGFLIAFAIPDGNGLYPDGTVLSYHAVGPLSSVPLPGALGLFLLGMGRLTLLRRRTSIDELPQLFNVLKGDMGLVGSRPLPIRDFNGFDSDLHRRRFSVKPGITCLWQISGRSNISFEQWMELDMDYIDHWSLWLDLKILAKTIPAVLLRTGAE